MTQDSNPPAAKTPALDPMTVPAGTGSGYPEVFGGPCLEREKRRLGDAFGLTKFGVNLVTLPPGAWSAQRHWHSHEDEFVYIVEGELTLVTDAGAQRLTAGMTAGFRAGVEDGHHLVNRSDAPATYLEIGDRDPDDSAGYPDIDLAAKKIGGKHAFFNKKGERL